VLIYLLYINKLTYLLTYVHPYRTYPVWCRTTRGLCYIYMFCFTFDHK